MKRPIEKTMIPRDILGGLQQIKERYPVSPIDNKPWGAAEILRYVLKCIVDKEVEGRVETLRTMTSLELVRGNLRARRGPKIDTDMEEL